MNQEETLSNLSTETRSFPPEPAFVSHAVVDASVYDTAAADRMGFWAEQAQRLEWAQPWTEVLDWSAAPKAAWFVGGRLNVSVNCLDRHVRAGLGNRVAFHFEGEPGDTAAFTYSELLAEVCRASNALTALGLVAGDRVAIYLPMIPEAAIAMLACARLGLTHSVVFGGFSADALSSRIADASARLVITSDGGFRKGAAAALKPTVDEAVSRTTSVEHVLVVRRTEQEVAWTEGRDLWWHEALANQPDTHTPEFFDSEHPLFILYTSGTTAAPKGIVHTTGGYLTQVAATHRMVFDLHPDTDVYWCTADVGWVTGHSYVVYGPLANAATSLIYEGTPDSPTKDRWWSLVARYGVTILYTAPTAIRTFMKWGEELPGSHDLSSLRLLGSVGEPINPEAWMWYRRVIGADRCPIVDTWWQTETGAIMITPLPGVTATKPGSAMTPFPGISAVVLDESGEVVPPGGGGYLALTEPWPSMLRGIWGDPARFAETYWSRFPGVYFAGDGAKTDPDGTIWLLGRVDDVMNVSGHRISTTEVESALVSHPSVAEAAVVGAMDATTGQAIVAFVTVKATVADAVGASPEAGQAFIAELRDHVATAIGKIARPRDILLTPELPKTRSGKIMRRLLRDVAEHRPLGDVTTLADPSVVTAINDRMVSSTPED